MAKVTLTIDLDGAKQVPQQLRERITELVRVGLNQPGNRLPTVRELALDLELNANAVKRFCDELQAEGLLMWREGAGVYAIDLRKEVEERRQGAFDV